MTQTDAPVPLGSRVGLRAQIVRGVQDGEALGIQHEHAEPPAARLHTDHDVPLRPDRRRRRAETGPGLRVQARREDRPLVGTDDERRGSPSRADVMDVEKAFPPIGKGRGFRLLRPSRSRDHPERRRPLHKPPPIQSHPIAPLFSWTFKLPVPLFILIQSLILKRTIR